MKKRRTLVISLLLVAALALGIGYANYTVNLAVRGVIRANAPAPLVKFTDAEKIAGTESVTSSNGYGKTSTGGQEIELKLEDFKNLDDYVTVEYTVTNGHDFAVTLSAPDGRLTDDSGTIYSRSFDIMPSETFVGTENDSFDASGNLKPGKSATFTVTVRLKETFVTDSTITQSFKVTFTATGVANTDENTYGCC